MSGPELPGKTAPTLHLVRHGQSTWNVEGRLQGQVDHPELTDRGRKQAADAATLLAGFTTERLLTSDLRRALQTAEIIGETIGLAPVPTRLLRELDYGALQGLTTEQASAEWERLAGSAIDQYGDPIPVSERRLAGGESLHDVRARIAALLAAPWVTEARGDVVIVTHGDTIRIMLSILLSEDPDDPVWRKVGNGEVHSIHRTGDGQLRYERSQSSPPIGPVPEL